MSAQRSVEPVVLTARISTLEGRKKALAAGLRVVDAVAEAGNQVRGNCGDDYACLLAWAEAGKR